MINANQILNDRSIANKNLEEVQSEPAFALRILQGELL